jgi:IS30 family transposase
MLAKLSTIVKSQGFNPVLDWHYRARIPNRMNIDQCPDVVDSRSRIGDWEVDLVIGKGRPTICCGLQYSFSFSLM